MDKVQCTYLFNSLDNIILQASFILVGVIFPGGMGGGLVLASQLCTHG